MKQPKATMPNFRKNEAAVRKLTPERFRGPRLGLASATSCGS